MDIFSASKSADHATVLAMIKQDPNLVRAKGPYGASALHLAATPEVAQALLERGAEIEAVDDVYKATPLQWSLSEEHAAVVGYLLDRGASVDFWSACALDDTDRLATFLTESPQVVNELSSDKNVLRSDYRAYPIHYAARYGSVKAIRLLLDHGASVLARSSDGSLPIHDAAFKGHVGTVKLLIEERSPINDRDHTYDLTPLGTAEYAGRSEVAAYLRAIGGQT
jgi:ankyrin repeat protein